MGGFRFYRDDLIEYVIIENSPVDFPLHCHSTVNVISYIVSGNVRLRIGDIETHRGAGEIFTVMPYESHSLTSESNVTMVTMCVSGSLTGQGGGTARDIIRRFLERFSREISGESFPENMTGIFLEKVLEICRRGNIPDACDPLILRSIREIEGSPEREERVEYFSGTAYMSRYHFIRKFRTAAGLTPHKFRIQRRVRLAQRLLASGVEISEAAQRAGFYDQSHLCRLFKSIVGISPGEYMRQVRNFIQDDTPPGVL